jgi:hypothetical protein
MILMDLPKSAAMGLLKSAAPADLVSAVDDIERRADEDPPPRPAAEVASL